MRLIAATLALSATALAAPAANVEAALVHARYVAETGRTQYRYERNPAKHDLGKFNLATRVVSAWGNCDGQCASIMTLLDSICNDDNDLSKCRPGCTAASRDSVYACQDCLKGPGANATTGAAEVASSWSTWLSDECGAINDPKNDPKTPDPSTPTPSPNPNPTTPDPVTSRPCDECVPLNPVVMFACNTSNPNTCRGLCSNLNAMHSCADCYNKYGPGSFNEYISYVGDADWYCSTDGGKSCSAMMAAADSLCGGQDAEKCKTMCTGDNWNNIKKCEGAVGNSGLTGSQSQIIADGIKAYTDYCKTPETVKNKTGCSKECDAIVAKNTDLCGGKDATKCREMCTDVNLGALDGCNTCAQGDQSIYSSQTKSSIQTNLNTLRTWCTTATTKPDDPEVIGNVPDPKDIEKVTKNEETTNTNSPSTNNPIKNPFGTSESSSSNNNDTKTGGSKGIPTWGIGVAAGGGAVAIIALVSSIVACNYECDHDHRKLRRRRKNKKKKDDEPQYHPQPMQQEPQQPQLVGYIYPNPNDGRPQSQGYFSNPASPPMSTPLSGPVSMAHTPTGHMSPPQSPTPMSMSPPVSPPPFAQPGQHGMYPTQQYQPYQPYPGGQQQY